MLALSELDVLILDCQATGASPALGSVLELGWCIARSARAEVEHLQAHWITLPPGHVVPFQVRRLTGFEERFADTSLPPEDAWARLRACLGGAQAPMPAAIHFARFELAFLRDWAARFDPSRPFPFEAVCVHALACRLYPDLPRRSLRALAGYLGYGLELTRNARGHVQATAFIWRRLCEALAERGVRRWDELAAFLEAPAPASPRHGKRRYPIASARYRALPDEPGVYRFVRSNGDPLYVGKAASLRKRVASHFKGGASTEHALEMLTQASDVLVTPTATALEAALLENETIKALGPPYNVQLVLRDRPAWFATHTFEAAAPAPDATHRIGPLPSEFALRSLGALLALVSGSPATRSLRAGAVGAAELWAPEDAVFAAGMADFTARHGLSAPVVAGPAARRALLGVAKQLALVARLNAKTEDAELEDPSAASKEPDAWDPERVTRHLERALVQAYQLLRRASWLCLLYDSTVVYREPTQERARVLVFCAGELVEARQLVEGEAVAASETRTTGAARRAAFDRAKYDRLRILTTELKRVRKDSGSVTIHLPKRHTLAGTMLDGILRWV